MACSRTPAEKPPSCLRRLGASSDIERRSSPQLFPAHHRFSPSHSSSSHHHHHRRHRRRLRCFFHSARPSLPPLLRTFAAALLLNAAAGVTSAADVSRPARGGSSAAADVDRSLVADSTHSSPKGSGGEETPGNHPFEDLLPQLCQPPPSTPLQNVNDTSPPGGCGAGNSLSLYLFCTSFNSNDEAAQCAPPTGGPCAPKLDDLVETLSRDKTAIPSDPQLSKRKSRAARRRTIINVLPQHRTLGRHKLRSSNLPELLENTQLPETSPQAEITLFLKGLLPRNCKDHVFITLMSNKRFDDYSFKEESLIDACLDFLQLAKKTKKRFRDTGGRISHFVNLLPHDANGITLLAHLARTPPRRRYGLLGTLNTSRFVAEKMGVQDQWDALLAEGIRASNDFNPQLPLAEGVRLSPFLQQLFQHELGPVAAHRLLKALANAAKHRERSSRTAYWSWEQLFSNMEACSEVMEKALGFEEAKQPLGRYLLVNLMIYEILQLVYKNKPTSKDKSGNLNAMTIFTIHRMKTAIERRNSKDSETGRRVIGTVALVPLILELKKALEQNCLKRGELKLSKCKMLQKVKLSDKRRKQLEHFKSKVFNFFKYHTEKKLPLDPMYFEAVYMAFKIKYRDLKKGGSISKALCCEPDDDETEGMQIANPLLPDPPTPPIEIRPSYEAESQNGSQWDSFSGSSEYPPVELSGVTNNSCGGGGGAVQSCNQRKGNTQPAATIREKHEPLLGESDLMLDNAMHTMARLGGQELQESSFKASLIESLFNSVCFDFEQENPPMQLPGMHEGSSTPYSNKDEETSQLEHWMTTSALVNMEQDGFSDVFLQSRSQKIQGGFLAVAGATAMVMALGSIVALSVILKLYIRRRQQTAVFRKNTLESGLNGDVNYRGC